MTFAREIAVAADPASVMRAAGMTPDPWQCDVLGDRDGFWLLLCSRQSGKTTACAAVALATAMTDPGALVLIVAPSLRQSQEAFRQVGQMYLAVHGGVLDDDTLTRLRLELRNGSRVQVIPGDTDARIDGHAELHRLHAPGRGQDHDERRKSEPRCTSRTASFGFNGGPVRPG